MSEEEMETSGEESEMAEDEVDMGDEEMGTSDEEVEPSDDEAELSDEDMETSDEEIETYDEDSEISGDMPTGVEMASTRPDIQCPYCSLNKVLALNHLHYTSLGPAYTGGLDISSRKIKIGSRKGCKFCGLLVDAIWAWKAERGRGNEELMFRCHLRPIDGQWALHLNLYSYGVEVTVFRGTGSQSLWNLRGPPEISGDTSSSKAVDTARGWLQTCRDTHHLCKDNNRMQEAPKRILMLDGEFAKLCEPFEPGTQYACLSHCWGRQGPALKLVSGNIARFKAGILLAELPKTFRDAASFCRQLGIHYIWIDALCILQDSENDWNEATVYMADTYASADVTIAATWSSSSDDGCFVPAAKRLPDIALKEPGLYLGSSLQRFPREVGVSMGDNWPLLERAWVFQERQLSVRVLHFGKDQLHWECNSRFMSEDSKSMPTGRPEYLQDVDFKCSHLRDPAREWRYAVEYYSGLKLTYEKDRLPAIAGFAKKMQERRPGDVYIAGMWMNSLLSDLAWYGVEAIPNPRPSRPGTAMPSWSWVSVSSGVLCRNNTPLSSLKFINAVYDITGPAHVGQVSEASITLQGSCVSLNAFPLYERPFEIIEYQDLFCGEDGPLLEISDLYTWDFDCETATFAMILQEKDKGDSDNKTLEFSIDGDGEDDWSSDDDNVIPSERIEENFVLLLLSEIEFQGDIEYFGIVLHEIEDEQFERVGSIRLDPAKRFWEGKSALRRQLAAERIASLPIRQFTIV